MKLYGHGEPLDNTAFAYLDISGLVPAVLDVKVTSASDVIVNEVKGVVKTKEQTT